CQNLDDRLRRHNTGQSKATRHGAPWILLYREHFSTREEAARKERYYKTGRGREELDQLVERSPRRQVAGSNPVTPTKRNSTVKFLFRSLTCAFFLSALGALFAQDSLPS